MKKFFALSLLILFYAGLQAQKAACCDPGKAAHTSFAALGEDPNFRNAHDTPREINWDKGKGKKVDFETPDGATAQGYYLQGNAESTNYLFVIHEWWGLNDHIRTEAERLHQEMGGDVHVIALDMYDGKVATTREKAAEYMQAMPAERGIAIIQGALAWAGEEAHIGTIGWCFGGGWSLQASIEAGAQAAGCVMYYGMPETEIDRLEMLQTDVLGIFASKDQWINEDVVEGFEVHMERVGKNLEVHVFEAEHAFANPSRDIYDEKAATEANQLALEFLSNRLKP